MSGVGADVLRDLPEDVARGLDEFVTAAREAFGDALRSVVLYGSAAEGALRATSDVNVILVLTAFEPAAAERLREAARLAHATINVRSMFLLRDEVAAAGEAFAQKFSDVRRRHRVLWGEDPFGALSVPRQALLVRVNQVLLNLVLRLRAAYVERGLREEQIGRVVADAAAPLRTAAASLLELEGRAAASPKAALEDVARALGEPGADTTLARMSEARRTGMLPPGVAGETLLAVIALATRMRARLRALA
jgi:predicted nucleotidyltransferase